MFDGPARFALAHGPEMPMTRQPYVYVSREALFGSEK